MKLVIQWNRPDIAISDVLSDKNTISEVELNELMSLALLNCHVDFVDLLLEKGLQLESYLNRSRLNYLYQQLSVIFNYRIDFFIKNQLTNF